MASKPYIYYVHTMPGLEEIAWTEARVRLSGASFEASTEVPGKNGLALFRYDGEAANLLSLRTAEDVFFLVHRIQRVEWGRAGLTQAFQSIERNRFIEAGLAAHQAASGVSTKGTRTFRVISRMTGGKQPFRRTDFQRAIVKALANRLGKRWRAVEDGGEVEFWANLIGSDFICGMRLSDARMRHRDYKQSHIAASLRPSVAATLVWLSDPQPGDIFLDPMCGAGTILVERGLAAPHTQLLGGDIDTHALSAAADNIGRKHKPRQLLRWDAGGLPIRSASVDKIATNPPFGKQLGSHSENVRLYDQLFREIDRVLHPMGRAIVISSETDLIRQSVRSLRGLRLVRGYTATILGLRATVHVIERPN